MLRMPCIVTHLTVCLLLLSLPTYADKLRLEFWTQGLSPKFDNHMHAVVRKYNAQQNNIEIVWIDYPWDIIQNKLPTALATGKPPALAHLNVPTTYDYFQRGLIQPVDKWIMKDHFINGALADASYGGQVYGFPFFNGAHIIAFNTAVLGKAGLDYRTPPNNLDTMLHYAKTIRAKTGVAGYAPELGPTKIEGLMLREGLEVVKNNKAVFNTPAHIALITKLADAYQAGALLKDNLFAKDNFQASMAAYSTGRLAMMVSTPTTLTRVRDDAPSIYQVTEVAPAPLGKSGAPSGGWMFNLVIPKTVAAPIANEAGKFASFFVNAENQLAFAKITGALPTSRLAIGDPYFSSYDPKAAPIDKAIYAASRNIEALRTLHLPLKNAELLAANLSSAVEKALTGRLTPKQALDESVAYWNKKLSESAASQTAKARP